ncbi:MAG TPA: hypothetical protein VMH80_07345 [Bryobacteraceae bacterium]|nr:hypothetical protein [Bryobacteraceae bacterium]
MKPKVSALAARAAVLLILMPLGAAMAQPVVRGVLNAANGDSTQIARGSFMSIYGQNLGQTAGPVSAYPIPTTLGGAQVTVAAGGKNYKAYLDYVSPGQINAIMPSAVPAGEAQLTVTVNNVTSTAARVTIGEHSFGMFTINSQPAGLAIAQNYESPTSVPLNLYTNPAKPGQTIILWGTGLGALPSGTDDQPPGAGNIVTNAKVLLNGSEIVPDYAGRAPGIAGVDQINFTIPADTDIPDGCSLYLQVDVGGIQNGSATIAKSSDGSVCKHPFGLSTDQLNKLQFGATMQAAVAIFDRGYSSLGPGVNFVSEEGVFYTQKFTANGSPLTNQGFPWALSQPAGSCAVIHTSGMMTDFVDYLGIDTSGATTLDAGKVTLSGPGGNFDLTFAQVTLFNGMVPQTSGLVDGNWTLAAAGGRDVGAFSVPFTLGSQFNMPNFPTKISRGQPLALSWTGGGASDLVRILINGIVFSGNVAAVVCTANAKDGSFTVPASFTQQLDSSPAGGVVAVLDFAAPAKFNPPLKAGGKMDAGVINLIIGVSSTAVLIQ